MQRAPIDRQQQEAREGYGEGKRADVEDARQDDGSKALVLPVPAGGEINWREGAAAASS